MRRADAVIVPSAFLARLVESWGVPEANIRTIYNAVEPAPEGPVAAIPLQSQYKIATAGRLVSWKRIDLVLDAVAELGEGVGLVIVGDGPEEPMLKELASRRGVAGRVWFAGRLDRQQLMAVLAACDVFVLNSSYEGFPHVVLEAMQLGLPVVATDVGGTGELLEHRKSGLLIEVEDPEALRSSIRLLLSDPERSREMGRSGLEVALRRFSTGGMIEDLERVLREVLQSRRSEVFAVGRGSR